jgi:hypothetical protein
VDGVDVVDGVVAGGVVAGGVVAGGVVAVDGLGASAIPFKANPATIAATTNFELTVTPAVPSSP